jgi:NAD(P)-dependent dehydrogenase (short-subunit alcohol dehydrogenase family)
MGKLAGKVAVVTGSTAGGIGTAIAREFAQEGASVVITGRREDAGTRIAASIRDDGGQAVFVAADLTVADDCDRLLAEAVGQLGSLDVLVNNAVADALRRDGALGDVADDTWDQLLAVNLTAAMRLSRRAVEIMKDQGGGVVLNVSSRASLRAGRGNTAYASSKGGLNALTRAIAVDYAEFGIRANALAPGFVVGKEKGDPSPERQAQFAPHHLTRMPTAQDVARAAVFLASDDSATITGVVLPVDGGATIARGIALG